MKEVEIQKDILANQSVIQVDSLSRYYTSHGHTIKAVDQISFQLPRHKIIAISGPSGCGKSTLLYLLGCLEKPTSGTVMLDGINVHALRGHAEDQFRRTRVGFVFQFFHLVSNLSALENVVLPMDLAGKTFQESRDRACELLDLVGIDLAHQQHRPSKLSGGEQQRVAIARALANDPTVLLADEPTGNLDHETGQRILDLLRQIVEQGRTVIVVTHDQLIANQADMLVRLKHGRIVSQS